MAPVSINFEKIAMAAAQRISLPMSLAVMSVSTPPGKTTDTVTDVFRSSTRSPSVNSFTAAFAAP